MKTRHLPSLLTLALVVAAPLHAQFNLGELKKNLVPALPGGATTSKVLDNTKDAGKVLKGAAGIGPAEELVIGESVALEIVGKYGGLVRDDDMTKRVNLVGRSLAYYSTRPALNWKFAVLDSPSINGFSAPGGIVFITRGLYDLVGTSDDALAAVLAHEIAHITGRHALKIIERAEAASGLTNIAVRQSGDASKLNAQLQQFDLGVDKIVKIILEKGFDPLTEYDADKDGRSLALTLGYAPGGLRQVLIKLQQRTGPSTAIFSTHPSLSNRIQRLPAE